MGYTLELGYWESTRKAPAIRKFGTFTVAKVRPFEAFGTVKADELVHELTGEIVPAVDEDGLVEASMDITSNFSPRIIEITGIHLAHLSGQTGADAAPTFMRLIAELGDEVGDSYWDASDGNIKLVANILLDWTMQHPDAEFVRS